MKMFACVSWQCCFLHLQRDLTARIRHKYDQMRAMRAMQSFPHMIP
ncbi:hypothetical protein CQR46_0089 [Bifidobacterium pseudolongum subsp. globosum]|uniref:Uncharacterized protein n=2 Tax=Bifidobacterium pseudolongum TaxID=1694 RepID=A0A2N3QLI4_9BIFI|nr:hypothetical protein CQR46_0089 [Bifidobacterium pseudolongum subsp. globosum]